jgi:hypothetical protein
MFAFTNPFTGMLISLINLITYKGDLLLQNLQK